jgi:uncharacterized protein (DUF1499 family)
MSDETSTHIVRKRSISWVVILGAGLASVSAFMLLAAPLGYRLGILPLRTALLIVFIWGAYVGCAAAGVSLIGLVVTLLRPREVRRGLLLAVISLLAGLFFIGMAGRFLLGRPKPPIHDITTDTQDPPQYVAVLPLRANAPNKTAYGGEKVAALQREAYPDIQPLMLNVPPRQAFDRALATVREMGWAPVAADAAAGRIEATDQTFWMGFKDDVVIRVRATDGGSRIDVRSLSRVGGGDVGTNATRIRTYLKALKAR